MDGNTTTKSGWDFAHYKYDLDKGLENVMPKSWEGHQRIRNYEMFIKE